MPAFNNVTNIGDGKPKRHDGRKTQHSRCQRERDPPLMVAGRIDNEPGHKRSQDGGDARSGEEDAKDRA